MSSLKVDGFVKPFRGKSNESWQQFWAKFLVLAEIQGWDDEAKRMKHFPLFLADDAFLVFQGMADADRKKQDEVVKLMLSSFSMTKSAAYEAFVVRKMKCDESTDAFVADLKRLAELSGHKVTDDKDPVVVQQLLKGLPADYNRQVRLSLVGKDMSISDCVSIVRALRISDASGGDSVSAAASSEPSGLCFKCGEPGHIRRNCPSRRAGGGGRSQPITCLFCDGAGHVKADCPERRDWLARKDRTAAAVGSAHPQPARAENDSCLVSLASPGKLPRIYVDVSVGAAKSSVRARAVIDTGSIRPLISRSFATQHGISLSPTAAPPILALDGSPLELVGSAAVRLARSDGAVSLPGLEVQAYVVDNLSVVNADVLVGNGVVTGSGGLRLKYSRDSALIGVEFGYDRVDPEDSMRACGASSSGDRHPFPNVLVQRESDDRCVAA
eukprot:scpid25853/ scgid35045/ 